MNIKILLASFFLVFLAELGDKTQLTALAFSTSSRSPWSVFLGTSMALVLAAALAVLCGEAIARVVPKHLLQLASAVMFVLVGLALLVNLARQAGGKEVEPAAEPPAVDQAHPSGPLANFVSRQAVAFEEDLAASVHETALKIQDDKLRNMLLQLEESHRHHARSLSGIESSLDENHLAEWNQELKNSNSAALLDTLQAAGTSPATDDELGRIIQRQEAAAEFYIAMARLIRFHDARDVLRNLAMEEIQLAQELCTLINHDSPDTTS